MRGRRKSHKQRADPQGRAEPGTGSGIQAAAVTSVSVASTDAAEEVVAPGGPVVAPDDTGDGDRAGLVELYGKALDSFERTMVGVTSGALALSITFIHDLTPSPVPSSVCELWWGWGALLTSLAVIVLSMPMGHWVLERAMEKKGTKWHSWVITAMNVISVMALLAGFFGLARFAQINMFAKKPAVASCPPTTAAPPIVPSPSAPPPVKPTASAP